MTDRVWTCTGQQNSALIRGFWTRIEGEEDPPGFSMSESADIINAMTRASRCRPAAFPNACTSGAREDQESILPYAHSGYYLLSGEAAAIFAAHDLGPAQLPDRLPRVASGAGERSRWRRGACRSEHVGEAARVGGGVADRREQDRRNAAEQRIGGK